MEHSAHPGGVLGRHAAALRAALLQPFLRLNFVTLWVRDQERSRRFFMETLDFETIVDMQTPEGGRWIVVAPPAAGWLTGTTGAGLTGMALVVPPEGSAEHQRIGQNTGLSFLTEDVRRLFAEWSRRGVRFRLPPMEPEWGAGRARYALFEDVDGNSFSLIEFDEATRTLEAELRAPEPPGWKRSARPRTTWQSPSRCRTACFRNASRRFERLPMRGFAIPLGPSVETITTFLISAVEGSGW